MNESQTFAEITPQTLESSVCETSQTLEFLTLQYAGLPILHLCEEMNVVHSFGYETMTEELDTTTSTYKYTFERKKTGQPVTSRVVVETSDKLSKKQILVLVEELRQRCCNTCAH